MNTDEYVRPLNIMRGTAWSNDWALLSDAGTNQNADPASFADLNFDRASFGDLKFHNSVSFGDLNDNTSFDKPIAGFSSESTKELEQPVAGPRFGIHFAVLTCWPIPEIEWS